MKTGLRSDRGSYASAFSATPGDFSPEMSARNIDTMMRYRDVSCITPVCDGRQGTPPSLFTA